MMVGARSSALALAVLACAAAFASDANERKFIREGMGEGEVLLKIGKPDHEAFIRVVGGQPEEKAWSYFPHARDPQTLTVVTFHAGVVTRVERKIAR
jgi:hypothetical protein